MDRTLPDEGKVIGHPAANKISSRKKKFNPTKSKLPVIVLILLLVYVTFSFSTRFNTLYAMQQDVQEMQQQVEVLTQKNAQLYDQLERAQSDAYVEEVAREKLGLVKEGEKRIMPIRDPSIRD
ncbi:MAG: septum formation initiator family protein [Firmicutes bacterium]|nr:septum formation initiator family protein [Bacillota bacterium]